MRRPPYSVHDPLETLAAIASLAALAFGIGLLGYGLTHIETEPGCVGTILGALLCLLAMPAIWRVLRRP
jgi:hypothetical protein